MGLDIMFHRTRRELYEDDYGSVIRGTNEDAKDEMTSEYVKCVAKLASAPKEEYDKVAKECLEKLATYFDYPEFNIKPLGYDREWDGKKYVAIINPAPLDAWLSNAKDIFMMHYAKEDAYFRKVNFIFKYFEPKMIDECFATVTKKDIEDLIDRCEKVLADHALCETLLPTTEGFFFGSTEYDDWYFQGVEFALEQFKKLLPIFDENCYTDEDHVADEYKNEKWKMYVYFSW